jgi:hypothetical protein
MSLKIGQTLGQYKVLDTLGAGGMGVVYKAQDTRLGRLVALKVLPQATAEDEEATERFRREARTASSLNHSNICTIYSFDEQDGQLFLAMELLEGETLDAKLSGHPLPLPLLLDLGTQIQPGRQRGPQREPQMPHEPAPSAGSGSSSTTVRRVETRYVRATRCTSAALTACQDGSMVRMARWSPKTTS